jgi:NAD(P)-dependent dehydrogenase (short-subunit alcohol dehydrogenase family)
VIALVAAAVSDEVFQLADALREHEQVVLLAPKLPHGLTATTPTIEADVLSATGMSAGWQLLEETYGAADGLVIVPFGGEPGPVPVADVSDALWLSTMVSLTVAVHVARAAVVAMTRRGRGRIVLVARRLDDPVGQVPGAAVSGAICQFARALATEVGANGITVNAISVAHGRLAGVAPLAQFLCSTGSAYLTAEVMSLDGPIREDRSGNG